LLLSALADIANCTLGDAILEIGVHSAEGKMLAAFVACLLEGVVVKLSMFAVIILDVNAMLGGKGLKCSLGGDGLNGGVINLEMNELQTRVVVHKDGRAPVAGDGDVNVYEDSDGEGDGDGDGEGDGDGNGEGDGDGDGDVNGNGVGDGNSNGDGDGNGDGNGGDNGNADGDGDGDGNCDGGNDGYSDGNDENGMYTLKYEPNLANRFDGSVDWDVSEVARNFRR
jgi:hypothetical protein